MSDDPILFERVAEHVAMLTLNRPDKRNAINGVMARRLGELVVSIEADATIRAVVLTSADGPVFCAGADLGEIAAGKGGDLATPDGGFAGIVEAARAKPWIAALAGDALGGGLELALACDLRIAATGIRLGLPEVRRGLIAGAGGLHRLPREIPRAVALEMIATGMPIDADRAYALGLVNAVVPKAELTMAALDLGRSICENGPQAVRSSLTIARAAAETCFADSMADARAAFDALSLTRDYTEGPRAFVEKRVPVWLDR